MFEKTLFDTPQSNSASIHKVDEFTYNYHFGRIKYCQFPRLGDDMLKTLARFALVLTYLCVSTNTLLAQDESVPMIGERSGNRWIIPIANEGKTKIPRVCASLRTAYFEGHPDKQVTVHPEIEHWVIWYKGEPLSPNVVLEFDSEPELPSETEATSQAGDGTITLACSKGITTGEKLRFEPQPHKNTIGYWAVAGDYVDWQVDITQPGNFNVGMLQGAGNNGGGIARISILSNGNVESQLETKVEVTGHFQNFIWKHAGQLTISAPGQYTLRIEAAKIDKVALMDVRQVHLSPSKGK